MLPELTVNVDETPATEVMAKNIALLKDAINSPITGEAIAARLVSMLCSPVWGYQHGSMMNLGNSVVASSMMASGRMSTAPLNDSTVAGWFEIDEILNQPIGALDVLVYSGVHSTQKVDKDGKFIDGKLYMFSSAMNNMLNAIAGVGNSGRPQWHECAHLVFPGEAGMMVPRHFIRGLDKETVKTLTVDEAVVEMAVPEDYRVNVFQKAVVAVELDIEKVKQNANK